MFLIIYSFSKITDKSMKKICEVFFTSFLMSILVFLSNNLFLIKCTTCSEFIEAIKLEKKINLICKTTINFRDSLIIF